MVVEGLFLCVGYELQRLEVSAGHVEALEVQRASLDTAHDGRALDAGRLRRAGVVDPWIAGAGGGEGGGECAGADKRVS